MLDTLPPYYATAEDALAFLLVAGNEIDRVDDEVGALVDSSSGTAELFPLYSVDLLPEWEFLTGLASDPTKTTSQRRMALAAVLYTLKAPASAKTWADTLDTLVGSWRYTYDAPTYTITVALPYAPAMVHPTDFATSASGTTGTLDAGTYYYAVTAVNGYGETEFVGGTTQAVGAGEIVTVSWEAPPVGIASEYRVYRGASIDTMRRLRPVTYAMSVTDDSPTLYWRLNETAGSVAKDSAGNSYDGTYVGSTATDGAVPGGGGRQFDGDSYVTSTFAPFIADEAQTMEAWIKRDSDSDVHTLFASDATSNQIYVRFQSGSDTIQTCLNGSATQQFTSTGVTTGDWHHVALVFDDPANTLSLYVDGELHSTKTGITSAYPASPGYLRLGARGSGAADGFEGAIAEVAFYGEALDAGRIAAHFRQRDVAAAITDTTFADDGTAKVTDYLAPTESSTEPDATVAIKKLLRIITPAHVDILYAFTEGFILDISKVGDLLAS